MPENRELVSGNKEEVLWTEGNDLCPKCERNYLREPKVWNSRDKYTQKYICRECSDSQDMFEFIMRLRGF